MIYKYKLKLSDIASSWKNINSLKSNTSKWGNKIE